MIKVLNIYFVFAITSKYARIFVIRLMLMFTFIETKA